MATDAWALAVGNGSTRIELPGSDDWASLSSSNAKDCVGLAAERGVRLVVNAGGLNPAGLAARLRELATGLKINVAHVEGDDLTHRAAELRLGESLGACDVVLASTRSTFAFTEVRLGLAPAVISLPLRSPLTARAASRYFLTGETFDAATAAQIGLVTAAGEDVDVLAKPVLDGLRRAGRQGLRETRPLTHPRPAARH